MELISPSDILKTKIAAVQEYAVLAGRSVTNLFRSPRYISDMLLQADLIGVGSLPIVLLSAMSIGMALALNTSATLEQFGSLSLTGQLVSVSMIREIGPVITSLMVSGRNASGMASELGSMKVTEQIDAMRALGTDPMKKLVTPRMIATVIMLFFLTILADLMGITGGFIVSYLLLGLNAQQYWTSAYQTLVFQDVFMGMTKPFFFGYIIATVGCYYGLSTTGGTQGVGRSTTQAVVASSVLILTVDVLITRFLMVLLGTKAV